MSPEEEVQHWNGRYFAGTPVIVQVTPIVSVSGRTSATAQLINGQPYVRVTFVAGSNLGPWFALDSVTAIDAASM